MEDSIKEVKTKKRKLNKNGLILISVILILLILVIILMINIKRERNELSNNMIIVNNNYKYLTDEVKNYNDIRTELIPKINNFTCESYPDKKVEYEDILSKYNDSIKKIDNYRLVLDSKCNSLYKDSNVNKICNSYKSVYEKLINLYVGDLSNYNNKLSSYGEYIGLKIEPYEMIYDSYIDYNNDNKYEGKLEYESSKEK